MLLDTSGLLAALFPNQPNHEECVAALRSARRPLYLSPFVLAELDYLVLKLAGAAIELELLAEVAKGAYELVPFDRKDVAEARAQLARFQDLAVGIADASLVVLSRRYGDLDVLTLDERDFRSLRGARGRPFRILPADR